MSLKPLLDSDWTIQLHVAAAMGALVLGIVQLWFAQGDGPHRLRGWIWVALMLVVSVSSFAIHELRVWGPWSPIHLLSIFTLTTLPLAVIHARHHRVARHRRAMISIFVGLVTAGLFTLVPGRLLYRVVAGG